VEIKKEIIKLTKKEIERCREFAELSVDSSLNHYKRRNNTSRSRIVEDITIGKCGEVGIYKLLKKLGMEPSKVDFEVYKAGKKSFNADIVSFGYYLHCKSQSVESALKYGNSWILQYNGYGRGHTDKLFKSRSRYDMLVPCMVDDNEVTVFGIIRVDKLFDKKMIKLPKVPWFQDTKRAIYWEDLKTLSWYERWGWLG
jgi:hypothetical protein